MPVKVKNARASLRARRNIHRRKNQAKPGRKTVRRSAPTAPRVVANSVFALTAQPKLWAELTDTLEPKVDQDEIDYYRDLVRSYNHAAETVRAKKVVYKRSDTSTQAVARLLKLFKENICPEGFSVNIDFHFNKRANREGAHFTIYKECDFPSTYWHFFDIKNLVVDLYTRNRRLHDLFIVFLRSFMNCCKVSTWYNGSMVYAEHVLADYTSELRGVLAKGIPKGVEERTGYTVKDMQDRLAAIEKSMKEYATGQAHEYMLKIEAAKPRTPASLLRSLKAFPPQTKLVQFMKKACELMKKPIAIGDFCYDLADGEDSGELSFFDNVTIVWDWHDHYSGTYGNMISDQANHIGVHQPTACARFMPIGSGGLKIKNLTDHLDFPMLLSNLQGMFQGISERYSDYETRHLL